MESVMVVLRGDFHRVDSAECLQMGGMLHAGLV